MIDPTLPLVDLHRHLDGAIRLATVLELGLEHGLGLPAADLEGLRPHVQIVEAEPDLWAFLGKFRWLKEILVDLEVCRRVGYEAVEDAAREGLDYVELRFSPWFMAEAHGLPAEGVVEAVADGVEAAARDCEIPVGLIGILSRHYGPDACRRELEALLACRDHLVALDLAGDEARFPAELFRWHFARGRDAGWQVTAHAGEAAGPASVWSALRDLGATRIGHGVRSSEDPALVAHLAEHAIPLEVSLTSNLHTSTVSDLAFHPLRDFLARGLKATINTDDPGISGIDLRHELEVAAPRAGIDPHLARAAQENAVEAAFLGADAKRRLRARAAERRST